MVSVDSIQKHKWWLFGMILLAVLVTLLQRWWTGHEHSQDKHILAAARKYNMDPALIKAVVWRESWFEPDARGKAGEIGLMQIRKPAAEEWAKAEGLSWFRHQQLFDPAKNTQAGTWYLRKCMARYKKTDNPVAYALADYNAGRTHVLRWAKGEGATNSAVFLQQMDFPGTRQYVQSVLQRVPRYQQDFK